jgi:hypothetical protein
MYHGAVVCAMNGTPGMMTSAKGQYQFDGNAGVLAAVHEMLLQSHVPQVGGWVGAMRLERVVLCSKKCLLSEGSYLLPVYPLYYVHSHAALIHASR